MRRWAVLVAACGVGLACFAAPVAAGHLALTKGPYLQNPSPTAITVQWETDQPGTGVVHLKAAGDSAERYVDGALFDSVRTLKAPRDDKAPLNPRYLYRARLLDLAPDTEYTYSVVVTFENGSVTSGDLKLRTWPEKAAGPVTFIIYGDSRSSPDKHRSVVRNFNPINPAFILHVGDLCWDSDVYGLWSREFFDPLHDVIDHVPMFIARGSHEKDPKQMLRMFDMPQGRTNYSFECWPVHFVVLDVPKTDDKGKDSVTKWVARDLAATQAPWRIAMYHAPSINFSGHRSYAVRTTYLAALEKGGVDFIVAGHSHQYERFVPLLREKDPDGRSPITFMTVAGGGAPLHRLGQPSPLLASAASCLCYTVFTVDEHSLTMKAFNEKAEEFDSLTVTKTAGRYDDAYLAKVRPLEEAILVQGVARMELPVAQDLPTPKRPLDLKLKATFQGLGEPVTLSVRLAESAEAHYAMEPASATGDAKNEEIKLVAAVRPLGKVATGGGEVWERPAEKDVLAKKTFLDPALVFIVTASAGGVKSEREFVGVVYGKGGPAPKPKPDDEMDEDEDGDMPAFVKELDKTEKQ